MTREYHEGYQQGYKDAKEEGKEPTTKNDLGVNKFDKAINQSDLEEWIMETFPDWCEGDVRLIMNHMDEMPSVTPQEPKTGHWILDETDNSITCDKCGCLIWANDISNGEAYYCPNCGAKMAEIEG